MVWGGWRHGLAGGRALQGPSHKCHPGRCLVSALPVQRDDVLRGTARVQVFGRDLEAAGVVACACGALGLSVSVLVKGLQEPSGHGVDLVSVLGVVLTEQPRACQAAPEQRSVMGWRAGWGHERQRKSPRRRQGLGRAMGQTTQPSSGAGGLDAAAELAAEAEGGAGAQDG